MSLKRKCAIIEFQPVPSSHSTNVSNAFFEHAPDGWEVEYHYNDQGFLAFRDKQLELIDDIKKRCTILVIPAYTMSGSFWLRTHAQAFFDGLWTVIPHHSANHFETAMSTTGIMKYHWCLQCGSGTTENLNSYGAQLEFYDKAFDFNPSAGSYSSGRVAGKLAQCYDAGFTFDESRQVLRENCSDYPNFTKENGYGKLSDNLVLEYNDVPEPLGLIRVGISPFNNPSQELLIFLRAFTKGYELRINGFLKMSGDYDDLTYEAVNTGDADLPISFQNQDGKTKLIRLPIQRTGTHTITIRNVDEDGKRSRPFHYQRVFSNPIEEPNHYGLNGLLFYK